VENKKIYKIMSKLGFLRNILPDIDDYSYEKLCSFVTFESCSSKNSPGNSKNITHQRSHYLLINFNKVFGNYGYHLILKGKVKPLSDPHLNIPGVRLKAETPEPTEDIEVNVVLD
jgi:hypothetical protein